MREKWEFLKNKQSFIQPTEPVDWCLGGCWVTPKPFFLQFARNLSKNICIFFYTGKITDSV
jgi:hypothetical protein